MTGLLKPSEVESIGKLGLLGMQSDVIIKKANMITDTTNPADIYGDDAETFTTVIPITGINVKGWLSHKVSPVIGETGGLMAVVTTYRLYLPVGTDVASGDRVEIGGEDFIVSDTTAQHTWLPMLMASLRRLE